MFRGRRDRRHRDHVAPGPLIFRYSTNLLSTALTGERLFDALLFTRLQIEGVLLYFLDNVFLLNFALKAPKGILDRFTILNSNFRQSVTPPIHMG